MVIPYYFRILVATEEGVPWGEEATPFVNRILGDLGTYSNSDLHGKILLGARAFLGMKAAACVIANETLPRLYRFEVYVSDKPIELHGQDGSLLPNPKANAVIDVLTGSIAVR